MTAKAAPTELATARVVSEPGQTGDGFQITNPTVHGDPLPSPVTVAVQPTQVRRPWRSTVRTVFQAFIMLCAIAPAIYTAAAEQNPELATGYAAVGLVVAGAVTRVMAVPDVERFLRRFVPFLAAAPKPKA